MRILLVNTFYYPNMQGGAEQSVKLLAEGMAKAGHTVAVFCVDGKENRPECFRLNGVHVYRGTTHRFDLYRYNYQKEKVGRLEKVQQKLISLFNREAVEDFRKILTEFRPDIVHTNTVYGISGFVWKAAHEAGIPVLHTVRDNAMVSPVQHGHWAPLPVRVFHRLYMRYTTGYLDAVTAPSAYTLNASLATGCMRNTRLRKVIYNSVSLNPEELRAVLAEKRSRTGSRIKFMFAGRLVYFKGVENMIRAFEQIPNEDCELHICGGGEERETVDFVEQWARKDARIRYCGKLNQEDLKKKYMECDVLLVPSIWPEPFGRVIVEGAQYGMPVISGNVGGIPEIYREMPVGRLVDASDVNALANAMLEYTNRERFPACLDAIGRNIEKFGLDTQIVKFERLYQRMLEHR